MEFWVDSMGFIKHNNCCFSNNLIFLQKRVIKSSRYYKPNCSCFTGCTTILKHNIYKLQPSIFKNYYNRRRSGYLWSWFLTVICHWYLYSLLFSASKKLLERISAKEDINKEEVVNQIKRNRVFRDPMISFVRQEILDQVNSLIDVIRQETASVKLSKKNRGNQKNVDSAFVNDIRDIRRMLQKLTKGEYEMFSIRDFVSDVKHSITTPLSRISVNADLLKKEVTTEKGIERLDHIYQSAQICQSVINSYSELVNKNLGDNIISIKKAAESFFEDSKDKDNKSVTLSDGTLPDNISGYSNSVVISALVPLIHNAVSASPIGGVVKMEYEETADSFYIRIRNLCEQGTPNVEKLSEQGFSTKHNHKGIGLQTVRNIVRLTKNSITLDFTIEEEKKEIEAILKLKKKIQNNETR